MSLFFVVSIFIYVSITNKPASCVYFGMNYKASSVMIVIVMYISSIPGKDKIIIHVIGKSVLQSEQLSSTHGRSGMGGKFCFC